MLKLTDIHELIRLLDESSLSELNLEYEDVKLHLKKASAEVQPASLGSVPQAAAAVPAQAVTPAQTSVLSGVATSVDDEHTHILTSPMVGTFYRAPSPDAPDFVEVGSQVTAKSVVCIVEAMKLMNEIEAEVSGEVVEILAKNGELVEYGQPLFKIRRT